MCPFAKSSQNRKWHPSNQNARRCPPWPFDGCRSMERGYSTLYAALDGNAFDGGPVLKSVLRRILVLAACPLPFLDTSIVLRLFHQRLPVGGNTRGRLLVELA